MYLTADIGGVNDQFEKEDFIRLTSLIKNFVKLRTLDLRFSCKRINEDCLLKFFQALKNLNELEKLTITMDYCGKTWSMANEVLGIITEFKFLREVSIHNRPEDQWPNPTENGAIINRKFAAVLKGVKVQIEQF